MNFSFDSVKERLLEKLTQYSNISITILQTSVYGAIVDVISYGFDRIAYYFEFLYRESIWSKAQLRKSLVAQADMLRYYPKRKTGAIGAVRVIGDPAYINYKTLTLNPVVYTGEAVQYNKWDVLSSEDGQSTVYATQDILYGTSYTIVQKSLQGLYAAQVVAVSDDTIMIDFGAPHGIPVGAAFSIRGTKNYNGDFSSLNILPYTNANTVVFRSTFVAETFYAASYIYTGHIYIPVREGTPKEFEYIASGTAGEIIQLTGDSIEENEFQVFKIDPNTKAILNELTIVRDLYLVGDNTAYVCSVKNSDDFNSVYVVLGDGIRSRKAVAGEHYLVKYAETKGVEGNIENTGVIVKPLNDKLTVFGNEPTVAYVNDEPISDGDDIEGMTSIRSQGKNLFFAGTRAETRQDYRAVIEGHPSVYRALVYTEHDLNQLTISGNTSVVYIAGISNTGDQLTVSQQEDIAVNYLNPIKALTDIIQWRPINFVHLRPVISGKSTRVPLPTVKNEVFTALSKYSTLNTEFNMSIYSSNVSAAIDDTDTILYHTTEIYHLEKSEDFPSIGLNNIAHQISVSVSSGETSDVRNQITILPESVHVIVQIKTANVLGPEILVGRGTTGFAIIDALSTDPLITEQSGVVFDADWTIVPSSGLIQGDTPSAVTSNFLSYSVYYLGADPFAGYPGYILNPSALDPNGFFVRIMYKTKNNEATPKFTNDIRLSKFNLITDLEQDDIVYKLIET